MLDQATTTMTKEGVKCAECGTTLAGGQDRETLHDTVFCRPCYNNLRAQMEAALREQSTDVNYGLGFVGACLGGAAGTLVWWGVTGLTQIQFGIVAVVIGLATGKGASLLAGNKRSRGLQIMSLLVAGCSFFYASYLVNRTFLMQAFAEASESIVLPLLPSPGTLYSVVSLDFGLFELLFLGIALWEAWRLPAPIEPPSGQA
jgi:hypothetical protein